MQSKILSRRDIDFLLYEWLDVEALTSRARFEDHSRETFNAALDTAEQIATDLFAPHNKKNDQHEPHFDGEKVTIIPDVKVALDAFSAAGLMASGQDYAFDGMQLPCVVDKALSAYFTAANIATSAYIFLTVGNANTLLKCASCAHCWPASFSAPCACPSRKRVRACRTSPPAPNRTLPKLPKANANTG
jgi:butyryl-CoA dehydrogenase